MENRQLNTFTNRILMVRPASFYGNPETSIDNHFQVTGNDDEIATAAAAEFDRMVDLLQEAGIDTVVFDSSDGIDTPDAVFPNNWFSSHRNGIVVLYPMKACNRRKERRTVITDWLKANSAGMMDLSPMESSGLYLEGTGSLVLDRTHRIAFAAVSERTDPGMVREWCEKMDYRPCLFSATDRNCQPVYHTNVVMNIGSGFTVAALDAIHDESERNTVTDWLEKTSPTIIRLSIDQLHSFAGNGIQLSDHSGAPVYLVSATGWKSLTEAQQALIASKTKVVTPEIPTIERHGGGSARCMVAELFLQK